MQDQSRGQKPGENGQDHGGTKDKSGGQKPGEKGQEPGATKDKPKEKPSVLKKPSTKKVIQTTKKGTEKTTKKPGTSKN